MHEDARARIDNFGIFSIDGDVAVDFIGRFETLGEDLKMRSSAWACACAPICRGPRPIFARRPFPIAIIITTIQGAWWRAGTRARSSCSITSSEREARAA